MKLFRRNVFLVFCIVLVWRVLLLVFTAQPIPANDAFGYDGGVVNYLHGGRYCNPSMALVFPISGTRVYSTYPPLYQAALFIWMKLFGTTVISAMWLHLVLFAMSGFLTLAILTRYFPPAVNYAVAVLFFFGYTFDDRPESLAFVFGLAALWLAIRQIQDGRFRISTALGLLFALLLALYTSVIVGAYFFGVAFIACAIAFLPRLKFFWLAPFVGATVVFAAITFSIAKLEPLWWAGFMESARQQSVMTTGFHLPSAGDALKLVRTTPLFLIALLALPLLFVQGKELLARETVWFSLFGGILVMGWVLLICCLTLLAPNYINYVLFTQVLLGAGLLALAQKYFPARERMLRAVFIACVLLVSVRAMGMTTWGVACAWKNSYANTQTILRGELKPFVSSDAPVLVSSAFLYCAADMGVKDPIHCDWYFDHTVWKNDTQMRALARLRPAKILLTQFDYYRGFQSVVEQLGQHPERVEVRIRNFARVEPPDAIPSVQRVIQQISWAPVVVDLDWKPPHPR